MSSADVIVLVSLPILSAILLEYQHKCCLYFSSIVLKLVSAILFRLFFGNIRYQYFCQQMMPLRLLLHNNARGTTSWVSAHTHAVRPQCREGEGDVGYIGWTHVLELICSTDGRTRVRTLTINSGTFALKHNHKLQFNWHPALLFCG